MNLIDAQRIAEYTIAELQQFCKPNMCLVAGSVRRKRDNVKDIEIVCLRDPQKLFDFVHLVNSWRHVKGEPTGRLAHRILPEGIGLDLFMPEPHDFYREYAIRTGSAGYSHLVLAMAWVNKGWHGTPEGLRKESDCVQNGSGKWICTKKNPELPPVWKSEEEFFAWLGIPWVPPERREV